MLTWISRSFKSISRHLNYYFNKHICLLTLMFVQQRLGQSKNVYVSVQWIKSELSRLKWFWKTTLFLQWVKNYDFYLSRVVVHGLVSESKGQLISKCLFGIFNSPKRQTKKFDFITMVPQVELFSFIFWENWRHHKYISKLRDL